MRTLLAVALFATLTGTAIAQGTPASPVPTSSPSPAPPAPASISASPSASAAASVSPQASSAVPAPSATSLSDFAKAKIEMFLKSGHADAADFSASFLGQVSVAQVDALLGQLQGALGDYKSVSGDQGDFTAHFAKGTDEVLVHLDGQFKINGLFFKPPKLQSTSLDDALDAMRRLKGKLSYVIIEGRSQRAALDASAPRAVGSTFKLAVLAALRDEIAKGRRHWTDVLPLDGGKKSLPSGVLQTWPDGTPITIATYAAEMISISDNTAADVLVRADGQAALAPYAMGNEPFITTREMFTLKSSPGIAARTAYQAAKTAGERAAVIQSVDKMPLPAVDEVATDPILAVEWHYSVEQLCGLMRRVADLPLVSINAGVADAKDFRRVSYKGGSDFGAMNGTTQVTTKLGTQICFSATLNDDVQAVDENGFLAAYGSVLNFLKDF